VHQLIVPETVNFHLVRACNMRCRFCFGGFPDLRDALSTEAALRLIRSVAESGVRRLNFSGGEPTLHPELLRLMGEARRLGMTVSLVTNTARLTDEMLEFCRIVAFSIDALDADVLKRLGRFDPRFPDYVERVVERADAAHRRGCFVKINVVVTALNADADLTSLWSRVRPDKVKFLQFVEVLGENDAEAAALRIDDEAFRRFCVRNRRGLSEATFVDEDVDVVRKTYAMIDPLGRVFQHDSQGGHRLSRPVIEIGFMAALAEAGGYDRAAFEGRGGHRFPTSNAGGIAA
jgi:radical S-adenosyl methionine domain-containing protein 2